MAPDTFGKPSLLLNASKSLIDVETHAFVANGLLSGACSSSSDTPESQTQGDEDAVDAFCPSTTSQSGSVGQIDEDGAASASSFVTNGLLGASTTSNTSTTATRSPSRTTAFSSRSSFTTPFSQTQDDDDAFPEISDLLRDHARPGSTTDGSFGGSSVRTASGESDFPSFIIRASSFDGKPVYVKKKSLADRARKRTVTSAAQIGNLLDVPVHRMLDDLAASAAEKLDGDRTEMAQMSSGQGTASTSKVENDLWVDRYRPRRYTDLLGDDRVHREVMAWLKEWDWCVFGKGKRKKVKEDDGERNLDEYRRPREKLLLISGPPGLGKTTLAHVVAQQAGYKVFEINASDARSGQVVDERIKPALESGAAVGSSKPVLVVIDEIDGATGAGETSSGFIQKLVQLVQENPKKKRRKGDNAKRPILRPIICICNDLYASSLAKLRPHARVVRLARPMDIHLVRRLREICEIENLKADSRALATLVGIAQGDLRGCLNTLQFIKTRGGGVVTESMVQKATVGMKEVEASQLTVLNDLFSPMSRKRVKELGIGEEEESKYVSRLSREVEGTGAVDKITLGCFEHYANLHKHDGTFARYEKAVEWLGSYDLMSGEMRTEREYSLLQYLPYLVVPFYPLFQERGAPRVERPKADWENYVNTRSHEEIYKSFSRCVRAASGREAGSFRHLASDQILQLELSPYINRIISPPLRPVSSTVIRPEERATLSRLVDLMVSLELRFIQDKGEDGQLVYRLDPPLDVFVTYDGKRASDIATSRYAVRHLVAAEIEARLISRQVEGVQTQKPSKKNFFGKRTRDETEEISREGELLGPNNNNKRAKLENPKLDIADRPPTDFFGRLIDTKKPVSVNSTKKTEVVGEGATIGYLVRYKFNEGNSAAVRKPVKVSSFI